ncbi:hypothetical protein ACWD6R_05200 [Streptomyces sp. NPDC005151]
MLDDVTLEQVEGWADELAALTSRLGYLFARPEPREVFADLIEGLLSDLRPVERGIRWGVVRRRASAASGPGLRAVVNR